jgi:hypothetical protein
LNGVTDRKGGEYMIAAGRALSLTAIIAYLAVGLQSVTAIREYVNGRPDLLLGLNLFGGMGAVGTFGAWGLALYHWGTRYAGPLSARRRWGVALTFGMFVGAWCYWLTRREAPVPAGA